MDTSEASFPLLLVEKPSALLSRERLLTASTLVAVLVAAALTLGSLLLALSLRRLLRVPQHRGSFSLGKQLLDDTDDDGLVGDDKKTLRRLRGNQDEEKGHSQTYSHGEFIFSSCPPPLSPQNCSRRWRISTKLCCI